MLFSMIMLSPSRNLLHFCKRSFTINRRLITQSSYFNKTNILQRCELKIPERRLLKVTLPYNVKVIPIDAWKFPELDILTVELIEEAGKCSDVAPLVQLASHDDTVSVSLSEEINYTNLERFTCLVFLPITMNLDISLHNGGNLILENLVVDSCRALTRQGTISIRNLKGNSLHLETIDGDVIAAGLLKGSIFITITGHGSIGAQRIIAKELSLKTKTGQQKAGAIYAEHASIATDSGDMDFATLHGTGSVSSDAGLINIGGLDGDFKLLSNIGNVNVLVTRTDSLHVSTNTGNINVNVPDDCNIPIETFGKSVQVEESLQARICDSSSLSTESQESFPSDKKISIDSKEGSISIKKQDWVSSLNLGSS